MSMNDNGNDVITELTNNILEYVSNKPLYIPIDKKRFLKMAENKRDNILKIIVERYFFKKFADDTNLKSYVCQIGITLVKEKDRKETPYFFHYLDNAYTSQFEKWLAYYEEKSSDKDNVPVKINELLCERTDYWNQHSFPMIIVYKGKIPFFINKNNGDNYTATNMVDHYDRFFSKKADKDSIKLLHSAFIEEETYSTFKIFFTSNFKNFRAQTFIKFKKDFCDLYNKKELQSFIKLCFLIDLAIGNVVKDFENIIFHHEYHHEILSHGTNAAMTAIMSRNFSHNIGSHVLSTIDKRYLLDTEDCRNTIKKTNGGNHKCNDKVIKSENIPQTMDFFSYLQKRMDLIARMVGGQYTGGEPMYFVGDVLNGFFKQDLLLNHLVQDQRGFEKNKIQFKICLPEDEKEHIFTYRGEGTTVQDENNNQVIKKWECDEPVNDFLVSIPDGEIGCQAFYLFLESMMRNSAKYGFNIDAETFQITIKLEESENKEFYKVTIGDNLSLCNGELVEKMRGKIEEEIVDTKGVISTKNFGIAEMREACRFLIEPFGDKYPAHEHKGKKYPLGVDCPASQTIHYSQTKEYNCHLNNSCNHLAYTFNLMKPQMVAIVGKDDDKENSYENKKYGIEPLTLNQLKSKKCAYQFVLFYVNDKNKDDIMNTLVDNDYLLPFRLLLVGDSISVPNSLPKRRVIICNSKDISLNNIETDENAKKFIISTYEAWIKNRWLKNQCANLILAFDRDDNDPIFEKYSKIENINLLSDKVNWIVDRAYWCKEKKKFNNYTKYSKYNNEDNSECKYYIYENHSCDAKARQLLGKPELTYLHNTGEKDKKIFETLFSPPYQNSFTFKYFLLGLLEAALTKVIIIDERVSESCIDQKDFYSVDHLDSLNKCLSYPVFNIENVELNEEVKNKIAKIGSEDDKKKLWKLMLNSEILIKNGLGDKLTEADYIVIHYGIVETHEKLKKLKKLKSLYSLSPSIVITSGRGAGTIKKDDSIISNLPFMEASILKDNTYPSISKYHLVRALMSTKGGA